MSKHRHSTSVANHQSRVANRHLFLLLGYMDRAQDKSKIGKVWSYTVQEEDCRV